MKNNQELQKAILGYILVFILFLCAAALQTLETASY